MKLQTKLTLFFATFSFLILIPITLFFTYQNKNLAIEQEKHNLEQVAKRVSHFMHNLLNNKVDSVLAMSATPIIEEFLLKSNTEFMKLDKISREEKIALLNEEWINTKNTNSKFFQNYLANELSDFLKAEQDILKDYYGEIFITNKYGSLVASTGKLTTLAHKGKYWWEESFNKGKGKIFLDDRGFDKSVGGYVIGIVTPIFFKNEIIGILKANLNIKGPISRIIEEFSSHNTGNLEIVRSGGLIVYKKGVIPLSESVSSNLMKELNQKENGSLISKKNIIAYSKISMKHNLYDTRFSGKPKTIDHNKGNNNESWHIIIREDLNNTQVYLEEIKDLIIVVIVLFFILSIILGQFVSYYISKPLNKLLLSATEISKGNLKSLIDYDSKDEIGQLAKSFNKMSNNISTIMDSKNELLKKIESLKNEYEFAINETNLVSKTNIYGDITYVNKAFCETLEYSEEELLGNNHRMHKDPNGKKEHYKDLWETIMSGNVWTGITTNLSKKGKLLYLHTSIFPIFNDNKKIIEFIAMRFDITNEMQLRKEMEVQNKELQLITKSLKTAQEIAKIGSYEFNIQTNNVTWSDEYFKIIDEEAQSFVPTFEKYLSYVHPDDIEKVKEALNTTIYLKEFTKFNYRLILQSGETKYVESTSNVIEYDLEGNLMIIAGTILDITDRVNQEKEIEEKNKILFHQSKMSTMGEMLGNIAHQWRQPLSVISTIATGIKLKKEVESLEDKEFYSSMDNINTSVQYLSKTIDDFRNFFNPNKLESNFEVKTLFDKTFALVDAQFKVKNIKIITAIEEIKLFGLENELLQALINILNNARDAFEDKNLKKRLIFINVYSKNKKYFIEIKDNAGGIEEEILDKIFEPYFTTKHQSQGTGIGLYMSKEIIEKHMYGALNVKNITYNYEGQTYKGALFTISFKDH